MAKERWLKARVRPMDKDLIRILDSREWTHGEISDLVRTGVRKVLFGRQSFQLESIPEELDMEINQVDQELSLEELNAKLDDAINF